MKNSSSASVRKKTRKRQKKRKHRYANQQYGSCVCLSMYLCQETYLIISVLIISVVYLITPGARGRQRQIQDTRAICSPQEF